MMDKYLAHFIRASETCFFFVLIVNRSVIIFPKWFIYHWKISQQNRWEYGRISVFAQWFVSCKYNYKVFFSWVHFCMDAFWVNVVNNKTSSCWCGQMIPQNNWPAFKHVLRWHFIPTVSGLSLFLLFFRTCSMGPISSY